MWLDWQDNFNGELVELGDVFALEWEGEESVKDNTLNNSMSCRALLSEFDSWFVYFLSGLVVVA